VRACFRACVRACLRASVQVKEGGAVELVVGEGLLKTVRSSSVGKLASALDEFVRDSVARQSSKGSGQKRNFKALKSLSDSDYWGKGLGVDRDLLMRLRSLELMESSGAGARKAVGIGNAKGEEDDGGGDVEGGEGGGTDLSGGERE